VGHRHRQDRDPEIAADAHRAIRAEVREKYGKEAADSIRILYGGSVKPDNARVLMAQPKSTAC